MIYKDQLEAVYALIEDPKRWTQGQYAKDKTGKSVSALAPEACRWCVMGAFECVEKTESLGNERWAFHEAVLGNNRSVVDFNDAGDTTHAEVLALLTSAIERAPVRSKGQS